MRRFLLLLCVVCSPAFAALPAATTWEVRTAGNVNNGGCFVAGASGVDYSQQDAAQYSFADLVITGTATIVTSASHTFVADDVGNCLRISAGTNFTQGFFQIVSVAAGAATLDRSAGTTGSTGGTYAVGGAVALPTTACANMTVGNVVWVKATGTYTATTSCVLPGGSNSTTGSQLLGYTTTRGDNGRATWTTATNSTDLIQNSGTTYGASVRNFTFTTSAGTKARGIGTGTVIGLYVNNCSFDGFSKGIETFAGTNFFAEAIEVKNSVSEGVRIATSNNSTNSAFYNVWIHHNGGAGIITGGSSGQLNVIANSVISNNTGNGITSQTQTGDSGGAFTFLVGSVLYSNGAAGFTQTSTLRTGIAVVNSIIYGNTGTGINGGTTNPPTWQLALANAYGSNGTDRSSFNAGAGDVALSANPFTDAASGDFTLNSTAGGGAALKAVGFPGVSLFGTGYLDIGALQSQATSGGGQRVFGSVQ